MITAVSVVPDGSGAAAIFCSGSGRSGVGFPRRGERAACRLLLQNRYVSLDEGCQDRELTLAELWNRILCEAGLPDGDPPSFAPFT